LANVWLIAPSFFEPDVSGKPFVCSLPTEEKSSNGWKNPSRRFEKISRVVTLELAFLIPFCYTLSRSINPWRL
jgi:hypothetical protein